MDNKRKINTNSVGWKMSDVAKCPNCDNFLYYLTGFHNSENEFWCIECGWKDVSNQTGIMCPICKTMNSKYVNVCSKCGHWPLILRNALVVNNEKSISLSKRTNTFSAKNIIISFAIILIVVLITKNFGNQNRDPININNPVQTVQDLSFNQAVQPLPDNGTKIKFFKGEGVAPFKIITPSGDVHYFVKVVDWNSKQQILSIFVRSGQIAETKLPLGSYEIRYATGKTWYGQNYLFGPETSYNKADKILNFYKSGNMIQGHTIELIQRIGGNLETSKIGPNNF
ncbi:MAG: zinc ribbon domain-containing protein [Desulfotomaculaceae bacterium]|nr:zinc ribbon domain-containing protein [Desulfotomaculaceae bacterium]